MSSCQVLEGKDQPFHYKKMGGSAISFWTRRENRKGAQFSGDKVFTLEKISDISVWPDPIVLLGEDGRKEIDSFRQQ